MAAATSKVVEPSIDASKTLDEIPSVDSVLMLQTDLIQNNKTLETKKRKRPNLFIQKPSPIACGPYVWAREQASLAEQTPTVITPLVTIDRRNNFRHRVFAHETLKISEHTVTPVDSDIFKEKEQSKNTGSSFIRRKKRMTHAQLLALEAEFQVSQVWSKETMSSLEKKLDLSYAKLYKWNYDRQKMNSNKHQN